jgi:hypothetical protein
MKDGRVAAIMESPQGTLMALYPDGSMEPYLPSNAVGTPTTTADILQGKPPWVPELSSPLSPSPPSS